MSAQTDAFIATEYPFAVRESKRTGIPVSVFLAQSADETGWGTSEWFTKDNNPAGIGVTGAAGAGHSFASLSAAFVDYANKLLGHGEAGQEKFAADVSAGADPVTLLRDLEASPWAAGHYGGNGLENIFAANNLGQYDLPGTKPPAVAPIVTGGGSSSAGGATLTGIDLNPLNWWGDITSGARGDIAKIVITGVILSGGVGLIVLGAWRSVSPDTRKAINGTAATAAKTAAVA